MDAEIRSTSSNGLLYMIRFRTIGVWDIVDNGTFKDLVAVAVTVSVTASLTKGSITGSMQRP